MGGNLNLRIWTRRGKYGCQGSSHAANDDQCWSFGAENASTSRAKYKGPQTLSIERGRKKLVLRMPGLLSAPDSLIEPTSPNYPISPLRRRTTKCFCRPSEELKRQGHDASQRTVCDIVGQMDHCLQSTRKTRDGANNEYRDTQSAHSEDRWRVGG